VPLLSIEFQRQFRPPTKDEVLRFRYTSYLGENHPAAKKVVLTASVKKLRRALEGKRPHPVDDGWEHKFKLLCGTRYNPETDMIHMSCEQFPYPAQNKRWLSDKIDQMINLASVYLFIRGALLIVDGRVVLGYPSRFPSRQEEKNL